MYNRDNVKSKPMPITLSRKQKLALFIILQFLFFSGFETGMSSGGRTTVTSGFPFEWIKWITSSKSYTEYNFFALLGNLIIYWAISIIVFYNGKVNEWLNE